MTFQDNLRHYREKAGYAQAKDFAAAIGVKYSTYIGYENQGREPKYDTLRRIAEALNVSIDTLLGFSGVDRYEEYRQLLERSGCFVAESDGKIIVAVSADKFMQDECPENADLITLIPMQIIFPGKAALCACMAGIVAEFDNLLSPAKIAYIPLAMLRHVMKQEEEFSTQDAPPDTAALIGKKILAASPAAQAAINEIIRDDEKE